MHTSAETVARVLRSWWRALDAGPRGPALPSQRPWVGAREGGGFLHPGRVWEGSRVGAGSLHAMTAQVGSPGGTGHLCLGLTPPGRRWDPCFPHGAVAPGTPSQSATRHVRVRGRAASPAPELLVSWGLTTADGGWPSDGTAIPRVTCARFPWTVRGRPRAGEKPPAPVC